MRAHSRLSSTCFLASLLALAACTVTTTTPTPDGGTGGSAGTGGSGGASGTAGTSGSSGASGSAGTGGSAGADGGGTGGSSGSAGTGTDGAAGSAGSAAGDAGGSDGGDGAVPGDATPTPDGGDSGTSGEAGADPCSSADPGNNDRDHASPVPLGTDFQGCLQAQDDIDFYEFVTPDMPVAGGVIVVSLSDVSAGGGVNSTAYAASDNGPIQNHYATNGTNVSYWFAAAPSNKYRVDVERFSGNAPVAYKLKVSYMPVNDTSEPNDMRSQAKPISVGTSLQAYFFAPYATSATLPATAWEDWYKVTLAGGSATISLTNVASDINGQITLYDNLGAQIANSYEVTDGATVMLNQMGIVAGEHYIRVMPFTDPAPKGDGSSPGRYTSEPYTLGVTQ